MNNEYIYEMEYLAYADVCRMIGIEPISFEEYKLADAPVVESTEI